MSKESRHFLIAGRVQGVGYRDFLRRTAQNLGIKGWVRNLKDGRVEVLAQGTEPQLLKLEADMKVGPSAANVAAVQRFEVSNSVDLKDFKVHSDGESSWLEK